MIHDRKALSADPESTVVISGHSHMPGIEETRGILWLNPGAAGPRRFRLPITMAFLWEEAGRPRAAIHTLFDCTRSARKESPNCTVTVYWETSIRKELWPNRRPAISCACIGC